MGRRIAGVAAASSAGSALGLLAAPAPALAHEKWFTDPALHQTDWGLVLSGRTALALATGALALALFVFLQRLIGDPYWPRLPFFARMARGDMTLLAVQTAIALIYMGVRLTLFAPQLALPRSPLGALLAALEVGIAFTFITGLFDRAGALALLALGLPVLVMFSPLDLLQQAQYAGVAAAVFLVGRTGEAERPHPPLAAAAWVWEAAWGARGVAALRVLAGVAILSVALADKVWNPTLGEAFLAEHPGFNVFRLVGLGGVSDATFVLVAGAVETAIGLLLIAGLLTRVVILVMLVPFNLTVPFLPAVEMIGHLPIFGLMYLLLVHGAGGGSTKLREHKVPTEGGPR